MNSLEFINKQIEVTKKQLAKYSLSKEQSDPNFKHKEADIQYIHNKHYTEQLQTLQQIKTELEAWEVVKKHLEHFPDDYYNGIPEEIITMTSKIDKKDYPTLKKALEVK